MEITIGQKIAALARHLHTSEMWVRHMLGGDLDGYYRRLIASEPE